MLSVYALISQFHPFFGWKLYSCKSSQELWWHKPPLMILLSGNQGSNLRTQCRKAEHHSIDVDPQVWLMPISTQLQVSHDQPEMRFHHLNTRLSLTSPAISAFLQDRHQSPCLFGAHPDLAFEFVTKQFFLAFSFDRSSLYLSSCEETMFSIHIRYTTVIFLYIYIRILANNFIIQHQVYHKIWIPYLRWSKRKKAPNSVIPPAIDFRSSFLPCFCSIPVLFSVTLPFEPWSDLESNPYFSVS